MTRRWEERLARKHTPAEPTVSGVQRLPTTSDATPQPPPIPAVALTIRSPLPLLHSPLTHAPAADGGEPPAHWTSNPQRALLIVAAGACTALLVLLYLGGFLG